MRENGIGIRPHSTCLGSLGVMGDNGPMEVTPEERQRLEEALAELEAIDPAELPDPASRLAGLLESLLERDEEEI